MKNPDRSRSRLPWALAIVAAALLAALVLVLWLPGGDSTPQGLVALGGPAASVTSPLVELGLEDVEPRAMLEQLPLTVPDSLSEFERLWGPALAMPMTEAPLEGTLRVWDPAGRELEPGNGWIEFRVWKGPGATHLRKDVRLGSWTIDFGELEGFDRLTVADIWTHGGPASPIDTFELRELPNPRSVELRVRQIERTTLRVLDATTGIDLSGVRVVRPQAFPYNDFAHPGTDLSGRLLVDDAQSPFEVPESFFATPHGRSQGTIVVSAPGYAWKVVRLDLDKGGERRVELVRAGTLLVDLVGADPEAHAALRLTPAGAERPAANEPVTVKGPIELSGMAPGSYRARVEVGAWFDNPLVLAEAETLVVAGEQTRLLLEIATAPAQQLCSASGMVLVPVAWKSKDFGVGLDLIGTPLAGFESHKYLSTSTAESPRPGFDAYYWHESELQVGSYELSTGNPAFKERIEVTGLHQSPILTVIPAPVDLIVHVTDAFTGLPIDTEELDWHPKLPEGVDGTGLEKAIATGVLGQYSIRAPAAPIQLQLWDWRYLPADVELDLSLGLSSYTLSMTPSCGITVRLMDGETEVPFPDAWEYFPKPASGTTGEAGLQSGDSFGRKFQVSEPGTYTLDLPPMDGFLPAPQQVVEVAAGHWATVRVELQRKVP